MKIETKFILIILFAIFLLFLAIIVILITFPMESVEKRCSNECNKFNYSFYKIEELDTYLHSNKICWCLNENRKPESLGVIENG